MAEVLRNQGFLEPSLKSGGMLWIRNHHVEIECSVQRGVNNYNILLSTVHKQNHHFVALCWYNRRKRP